MRKNSLCVGRNKCIYLKLTKHVLLFRLQHQVKKHNLVVASYDVVRNDIDFFRWVLLQRFFFFLCLFLCFLFCILSFISFYFSRNIKFNYCILDEGHVIKNGKTKLSKAIKQLAANFRVILSGTPIQVRLPLWSEKEMEISILSMFSAAQSGIMFNALTSE